MNNEAWRLRGVILMTKLRIGIVTLDQASGTVERDGKVIELLPHEFGLLAHLIQHAGKPRTYAEIADAVWNGDATIGAIRACVRRLRLLFWDDYSVGKQWIQNVLKVGYKFNTEVLE